MKLSRVQRLFVAIGHVDGKIRRIADSFLDPYGRERPHPHPVWDAKRTRLKELRARRKQLILEALDADETENLAKQANAYERGFCAGRRINNTTKTQHT